MSSNTLKQAISIRRLIRDLTEVLNEPLPNVRAQPLEDDLYVWHGNMRAHEDEDVLGGSIIHFVLKFPDNYPSSAPECRLCTPVPHPNVTHKPVADSWARKAPYRLALWDCIPGENFWNRAYSVQSVLVELQAFLFKEDLQYDTAKVTPARAAELALAHKCKACGSTHSNPTPSFDNSGLSSATSRGVSSLHTHTTVGIPTFTPARSRSSCLPGVSLSSAHTAATQRPPAAVKQTKPAHLTASPVPPTATTTSSTAGTSQKGTASSSSTSVTATAEVDDSASWITVEYKKKSQEPAYKKFAAKGKGKGKAPASNHKPSAGTAHHAASSSPHLVTVAANTPAAQPSTNSSSAAPSFAKSLLKASVAVVTANPFEQLQALDVAEAADDEATAVISGMKPSGSTAAAGSTQGPLPSWFQPVSKTHKKNLARSKKRQLAKVAMSADGPAPEGETSPTADGVHGTAPAPQTGGSPSAPSTSATTSTQQAAGVNGAAAKKVAVKDEGDGWTTVPTKGGDKAAQSTPDVSSAHDGEEAAAADPVGHFLHMAPADLVDVEPKTLISAVTAALRPQQRDDTDSGLVQQVAAALPAVSAEYSLPMGLFTPLPRDVILGILLLLPKPDIAAMATCCKGLAAAVGDGELWRALLKQHFPGSRLHVSDASAWRRAYMLESSMVMDELKCFYSRASFHDEVLGLPVRFTVNPKTELIDYIEADPDMMSVTTFEAGVRKSAAGDKIDAVLPMYITQEHFERAQPYLHKVLRQLAPHKVGPGGRAPPPGAWLDVIAKLLNTCVVLLSDKGVVVSERALATYTSVHRLLLALCERHDLWAEAAGRLTHFMARAEHRTKAVTPNLGELLPLVSLVPHHDWRKVGPAIMNEMFDRNILWMCKSAPGQLPAMLAAPYKKDEVDSQMLQLCWEGSVVSKRLMMFHVAFLRMVACPPGMTLADVMDSYDSLYGRPAAGLVRRFGAHVKRILEEATTWRHFFQLCCMGQPTDTYLTGWMKQCWHSSLKKKYHNKDTDFSRIQASGVSKILLKGESYTAPPGMKCIKLLDHWRWKAGAETKFLDASCLLYGPQGNFLEEIDYSSTRSSQTKQRGAVTHSGDIIDHASSSGKHTIDINLAGLGPAVHFLVITMSSWMGAKLSDIHQPYVKVKDPDTGMELCEYHLEDQPMSVKERSSAIIMCSIVRKGGDQWDVQAIGHVGQGDASNYEPIKRNIKTQVFKR